MSGGKHYDNMLIFPTDLLNLEFFSFIEEDKAIAINIFKLLLFILLEGILLPNRSHPGEVKDKMSKMNSVK